jgi:hypothetical protein
MHPNSTLKRFRFIPFRKRDISEMCLQSDHLKGQEGSFKQFYQLLDNVLSFEFHQQLETLKDSYANVDPDADTRQCELIEPLPETDFAKQLQTLLEQANYELISQQEINQALEESSLFKIRLHVDFNDFSEVLLFCRGESIRTETIYRYMRWFPKTIEFINYDRVVIYIRLREDLLNNAQTMPDCKPASALLKLFQNVPKGDLEMLFPNTSIRMRTQDKLLIGVPAVISGGIILSTKVGTSLLLLGSLMGFWFGLSDQPVELNKTTILALLAGFGALAGYIWKQLSSFKNRKLRFMQMLTQNLYFKNLDNNAGVFHRLISDAEDEECKEALLGYYFLLRSKTALTANELDQQIEQWFDQEWQCSIDFEIEDALNKLLRFELVTKQQGHYSPVDLKSAIKILDKRWDNYLVTE